ncbi:MAG: hypothetical protein WDN50_09835 [Bradyrhizobium sp.]
MAEYTRTPLAFWTRIAQFRKIARCASDPKIAQRLHDLTDAIEFGAIEMLRKNEIETLH